MKIACHDADEMNLLADEIIYLESGRIGVRFFYVILEYV